MRHESRVAIVGLAALGASACLCGCRPTPAGAERSAVEPVTRAEAKDAEKKASGHFRRGKACYAKGDYEGAIAAYSAAIELKPDYAKAYRSRGLVCLVKGDYDGLIADFAKAIELKPDYAGAYINRGLAYGAKGDYDRAIEDLTKAIELKPGYALAYVCRGAAYGDKGEEDRARRDFEKALMLDPDGEEGRRARESLELLKR